MYVLVLVFNLFLCIYISLSYFLFVQAHKIGKASYAQCSRSNLSFSGCLFRTKQKSQASFAEYITCACAEVSSKPNKKDGDQTCKKSGRFYTRKPCLNYSFQKDDTQSFQTI